jgi:hypothetical protein
VATVTGFLFAVGVLAMFVGAFMLASAAADGVAHPIRRLLLALLVLAGCAACFTVGTIRDNDACRAKGGEPVAASRGPTCFRKGTVIEP